MHRVTIWLMILLPTLAGGAPAPVSMEGPVTTEIVQHDGRFRLLRDARPYVIKGAGLEAADLAAFAARGGNSIRTWSTTNARQLLDRAHELGVTVALCLDMGHERHGFDYDDEGAVARQLRQVRQEVLEYRDHPALLAWIVGNELNLEADNPRVYDAVNEVSRMIHELDPHHPTTSTLAGFGEELAGWVNERAPDLDFVSIQLYGDLVNLPRYLTETGFARPYMVTEWGTIGHWEVPTTPWGAPIEPTSTEKAARYQAMYETVIASDSPYKLGSYVFLWGQKQERTPTWYGLFLPGGESTEAVDVMQRIWTGAWPANRAPQVHALRLADRAAADDVRLTAGARYTARVESTDPDGDALSFRWEIRHESRSTASGGDPEAIPALVPDAIVEVRGDEVTVQAPSAGAYRLFVYVFDGRGHGGHANVPFRVP